MLSIGCDIGALATKTVILDGKDLIASYVIPNEGRMKQAAVKSLEMALSYANLSLEDINHRGGTGWGEKYIAFPHHSESMISCLAEGTHWALPSARTIVNIGGLSTTIVNINSDNAKVIEYRTNDRCASGTGFFLELAAQALELDVEELGAVALKAANPAYISAQCAVFGESEIVTHINDGTEPADIAAGISFSIGASVASMAKRLSVEEDLVVTGGVAKNLGVIKALEQKLGVGTVPLDVDSQLIAAIGAALLARKKASMMEEVQK